MLCGTVQSVLYFQDAMWHSTASSVFSGCCVTQNSQLCIIRMLCGTVQRVLYFQDAVWHITASSVFSGWCVAHYRKFCIFRMLCDTKQPVMYYQNAVWHSTASSVCFQDAVWHITASSVFSGCCVARYSQFCIFRMLCGTLQSVLYFQDACGIIQPVMYFQDAVWHDTTSSAFSGCCVAHYSRFYIFRMLCDTIQQALLLPCSGNPNWL
jgi:hypothetical protein